MGTEEPGGGLVTLIGAKASRSAQPRQEPARRHSVDAFMNSLPQNDFGDKELNLRQALLDEWIRRHPTGVGRPVRLTELSDAPTVKRAILDLLPRDVPLAKWIEGRIGAEITIKHDARGQETAEVSADVFEGLDKGDNGADFVDDPEVGISFDDRTEMREARITEYFAGPFHREENTLRSVLVDVVRHRAERKIKMTKLSDLLKDEKDLAEEWRYVKGVWKSLSPPVDIPFCRWIEMRCHELAVVREPWVKLARGIPGMTTRAPVRDLPRAPVAGAYVVGGMKRQASQTFAAPPGKFARSAVGRRMQQPPVQRGRVDARPQWPAVRSTMSRSDRRASSRASRAPSGVS